MSDRAAVELFLERSRVYAHINALGPDWQHYFADATRRLRDEPMRSLFQIGFAQAIAGQVSRKEYEIATGWDFDTEEEFRAHLRELWSVFYPDEDPLNFC